MVLWGQDERCHTRQPANGQQPMNPVTGRSASQWRPTHQTMPTRAPDDRHRFTPWDFEYDFERDKLFEHRVTFDEAVECFLEDFEIRRNKR